MNDAPKQFDIARAAELHARLRSALPDGCKLAWRSLGSLSVASDRILVIDPIAYAPADVDGQFLEWPYDEVDIRVQVIEDPSGDVQRIVAVMIVTPNCNATKFSTKEVGSVAVDSAHMMIADVKQIERHWKLSEDDLSFSDAAELDNEYVGSFELLQEKQDDSLICTLDADGKHHT